MVTKEQALQAAMRLRVLKFYPNDRNVDLEVARIFGRMVSTNEQLNWLVETMVDKIGEWHGPMELRGVFCTRFKPCDGVEVSCVSSQGFTPSDQEMRSISAHQEQKLLESTKVRLIAGKVDVIPNEDLGKSLSEVGLNPATKSTLRARLEDIRAAAAFEELISPRAELTSEFEDVDMNEAKDAAKHVTEQRMAARSDEERAKMLADLEEEPWYQEWKRLRGLRTAS